MRDCRIGLTDLALTLVASALLSCAEEVAVPAPLPDFPMASGVTQVVLTPSSAAPGSLVQVGIRIGDFDGTEVRLQGAVVPGTVTGTDWTARASLQAPDAAGDFTLEVVGGGGIGHAVLHVSEEGCPPSTVREAGRCVPSRHGHRLHVDRAVLQREDDPGRTMQHPRRIVLRNDTLVICKSDALLLVDVSELTPLDQPLPPGLDTGIEVRFDALGLGGCEDVVVSPDGRFAVTSGRGRTGEPGTLASWSLPAPGSTTPPALADVVEHADGFEGLAFHEGRLIAARKPDGITVFDLSSSGDLEPLVDSSFDGVVSAWSVMSTPQAVFLLDAGALHEHADGAAHAHAGGQVLTLQIGADGRSVDVVGRYPSVGAPRRATVLPDEHLAIAAGASGIEIVDASDPTMLRFVTRHDTPGSVIDVAYDDGYLLASDWDNLRLFDATDPTGLRVLDGLDLPAPLAPPRADLLDPNAPDEDALGLRGSNCVTLRGDRFFACDFNWLFAGRIEAGNDAPRLLLHDRNAFLHTGALDSLLVFNATNAGRRTLRLQLAPDQQAIPFGEALTLAPGQSGAFGVILPGPFDTGEVVHLRSNDPTLPDRFVPVGQSGDAFQIGNPVPDFHLWGINLPAGTEGCVTIGGSPPPDRPVVLAFFSSW